MGWMIPMMMMTARPSSSSGVRILPTMSTTAVCLIVSARTMTKKIAENRTVGMPLMLGAIPSS